MKHSEVIAITQKSKIEFCQTLFFLTFHRKTETESASICESILNQLGLCKLRRNSIFATDDSFQDALTGKLYFIISKCIHEWVNCRAEIDRPDKQKVVEESWLVGTECNPVDKYVNRCPQYQVGTDEIDDTLENLHFF